MTRLTAPLAASPAFLKIWPPTTSWPGSSITSLRLQVAAFERRQRGDELEGRAGRIEAGDRAVGQRRRRVADRLVDLGLGQRPGEEGGFEGREGAQAEDFAGVDVHRDEAARQAAFGQRRLAGRLHVGVDRELQVVARHRRLGDEPAVGRRLAERVDLDPGHARLAAQEAVVGVLDPVLADLVAGPQALVARLLQLFFGDLADVAEDVGGERSVG